MADTANADVLSEGGLSLIELSGLDLRNGSISTPRGSCRDMLNYEIDQQGGLMGAKGWAKYDGTIMGPDLEQAIIIRFTPAQLTGVFQYGEQIALVAAGFPTQTLLCLGNNAISFGNYLAAAYPYTDYSNWVDPISFPLTATVVGLTSGATLSANLGIQVLTDATITVAQYNAIRKGIQTAHSAAVLPVPGDPLQPIDCEFTYNNDSYAIHDCHTFAFNNGGTPAASIPKEGHYLRNSGGTITYGRILQVVVNTTATSSWEVGTAAGYFILYDVPVNVTLPAVGASFDMYDANNVAVVRTSMAQYRAFASKTPRATRALLYKTTDQQIKTLSTLAPPGQYKARVTTQTPVPRTWTRPRLTREIPYIQKFQALAAGSGFAPTGANDFSIYEYTRAGLTQQLQALSPITAAEKFGSTTSQAGGNPWVNPSNLFADDAAYATRTPGDSAFIQVGGFDFSFIPPGSRILGISVRIKGFASVANTFYFGTVALTVPDPTLPGGWRQGQTNRGGPSAGSLTAADTSFTFGNSTDLWGEQLTYDVLQDPNFGIFIQMQRGGAAANISLNCATITVTYVPPSRQVYIRNVAGGIIGTADIPVYILHYSIDNGSFTDAGNPASGVLTFWVQTTAAGATATEGDATNAGMSRVIGPGEEIRTGPGGTGTLLGYTNGGHYPISFPPGDLLAQFQSRYKVIDANFYDDVGARAAFIVNGVEFCVMFDGTYTLRARTGRPTDQDNPRQVANHLGYLHLGYASGAVINTGTNRPLSVIGAPGSNTYNFGEPITGLLTLNGQTLGVWTDRTVRGLQGSSPAPDLGGYTPIMISPAIGAIEYSLASVLGEAVWMSYRGVETVSTVVAYGDFQTLPMSAKATPWLEDRIQIDRKIATTPSRLVYACGVRNKRQYMAFFEDGYYFKLTMFNDGRDPECSIGCLGRPISAATFPDYGVQTYLRAVVRHVYQGVRTDGKEIILASFENLNQTIIGSPNFNFPYVVQIECGNMWDIGLDMPRWFDLNGLYFGNPEQQQKQQQMTLFVNALSGTQLRAYTLVNFDGPMDVNPLVTSDPNVNTSRVTVPQYPAASPRVYLPPPQVAVVMDIPATGRMLRLRIDANQDVDSDVTTMPARITHIGFQQEPERVDRS